MEENSFYVEVRGPDGIVGDELTYEEAVELVHETGATWEVDGYEVDYGWASSGNYLAAKGTKPLNADRFVSIEREESSDD